MTSIFHKHIADTLKKEKSVERLQTPPAQRLLDFIIGWKHPVISTQNIMRYGPRPRNRQKILELIKVLSGGGWLAPIVENGSRDVCRWKIIRNRDKTNRFTVAR